MDSAGQFSIRNRPAPVAASPASVWPAMRKRAPDSAALGQLPTTRAPWGRPTGFDCGRPVGTGRQGCETHGEPVGVLTAPGGVVGRGCGSPGTPSQPPMSRTMAHDTGAGGVAGAGQRLVRGDLDAADGRGYVVVARVGLRGYRRGRTAGHRLHPSMTVATFAYWPIRATPSPVQVICSPAANVVFEQVDHHARGHR